MIKKQLEMVEERKSIARNLYYNDHMSVPGISRALYVSHQTIRNYISNDKKKNCQKRGPKPRITPEIREFIELSTISDR